LRDLIALLPQSNRAVLKYLMNFLSLVATQSHLNKMPQSNLSRLWGPILLHTKTATDPNLMMKETFVSNEIVSWLMDHQNYIF